MPRALLALLIASTFLAAQQSRAVTKATVDKWMKELSNWGRWGKEDQMGTVNLITPAKRRQAAGLVRDGVSVSLAHDTLMEKAADNGSPFSHVMMATGRYDTTRAFQHLYLQDEAMPKQRDSSRLAVDRGCLHHGLEPGSASGSNHHLQELQ
ncbi:MAG: hypothetical protein LC126_28565 [Bryobacterales bacterium]|nr:hypothetical protein [Bryobacterales bacterium]